MFEQEGAVFTIITTKEIRFRKLSSKSLNIRGFTLIELLVVLTIVSLLGALVAPNLWQTYQQSSERFIIIKYASEIGDLRRKLIDTKSSFYAEKNALIGSSDQPDFPSVPVGWVIIENSDLALLPTGVTGGGNIKLESPTGKIWLLTFEVLDGAIQIELK